MAAGDQERWGARDEEKSKARKRRKTPPANGKRVTKKEGKEETRGTRAAGRSSGLGGLAGLGTSRGLACDGNWRGAGRLRASGGLKAIQHDTSEIQIQRDTMPTGRYGVCKHWRPSAHRSSIKNNNINMVGRTQVRA